MVGVGGKPIKCVYIMHSMSPSKGVYWVCLDTVMNPELTISKEWADTGYNKLESNKQQGKDIKVRQRVATWRQL